MTLSQIVSKVTEGLRKFFAGDPVKPRQVDPARVTFARLGLLAYYG